jgi:allophanate hydrolase subunit 2
LADHQTTGGYPKVGTVISADVPRLGRLRPGQSLQFQEISAADGERAAGAAETAMQAMFRQISAAGPQLDLNRLQDSNLISGVIRAGDEVAAF